MRNKKKGEGRGWRLRVLAWSLAFVLALAGWLLTADHPKTSLILELTAAVVFAIGATWPYAFDQLYRLFVRPPRVRAPS